MTVRGTCRDVVSGATSGAFSRAASASSSGRRFVTGLAPGIVSSDVASARTAAMT
jgi:hypothetical protein